MNKTINRIDAGLDRLIQRQRRGQITVLSSTEIARECGCDDQTITRISNSALRKVAIALHTRHRKFIVERLAESKISEVQLDDVIGAARDGRLRENGAKVGRPRKTDVVTCLGIEEHAVAAI